MADCDLPRDILPTVYAHLVPTQLWKTALAVVPSLGP